MDGVLAGFEDELLQRVSARYPGIAQLDRNELPYPRPFLVSETFATEHRAVVDAMQQEEGFIRALPVVPGALEGWERILRAGYLPRICSAPFDNPHCAAEKLAWLGEHFVPHFGAWVVKTAIITRQKHLVGGIALIDDRPPPIEHSDEATWDHIIFDRPYNRTEESYKYTRLYGWRDPHLEANLAIAAYRSYLRKGGF